MDRDKLKKLITESAGNVFYTYSAHWNIVNRLQKQYKGIKILQIVLTALSTGGFLTSLISGIAWLSWLGGLTSAVSLSVNLYQLNFNVADDIKKHTDAVNKLWDVRESYKALLVDFDSLTDEKIQIKRDELTSEVSKINKNYPGTDEWAFKKAQKEIGKYTFEDGEADKLLNQK